MKKILIILVMLLSLSTFGQSKTIFQEPDKNNTLILLLKTLDGQIEIDGHIFDNNKSKDPIQFEASLTGIKIFDAKREYQYRKCSIENCRIIHLEPKITLSSFSIGGMSIIAN